MNSLLLKQTKKLPIMFMSSTSRNESEGSNKEKSLINNADEGMINKLEDKVIIEETEELQPHWAAMERRVKRKVPKLPGEGPQGRLNRRNSAWDAEYV